MTDLARSPAKPAHLVREAFLRLSPALVLLTIVVIYFAPFLFHGEHMVPFHYELGAVTGIPDGGDPRALGSPHRWNRWKDASAITLQYPYQALAGESLRQGQIPTWNPYVGCGVPALGGGQTYPFSPFFAAFFLAPNPWTYTLGLLAGCLWGAFGVFLWLRRFGLGPWPRALGAALCAFSPAAWRYMTLSDVWACWWLGWVLWSWDEGPEEAPRPFWVAAIMIAGMVYCGHAESALLFTGAAALYGILARVWTCGALAARTLLLRVCAAGLLAGALTAVHWLPVLAHLHEVTSYKFGMGVRPQDAYTLSDLFSPRSELYVSPALWVLLMAGILESCRIRALRALLPLLLGTLLLLFNPLAYLGFGKVLTLGGILPSRYGHLLFWSLLAPLFAAGAARLATEVEEKRTRGPLPVFGAALPFLLFGAVQTVRGESTLAPSAWQWAAFYGTVLLLVAGAALMPKGAVARICLVAALAATVLDPFVMFHGRLSNASPYAFDLAPRAPAFSVFNRLDPLTGGDGPPAFDAIRADLSTGHGRFAAVPVLTGSTVQCLASDLGTLWRLRDARLTEPLHLKRFSDLYSALAPQERGAVITFLGFEGFSAEALGRFGVGWMGRPVDYNSARFNWLKNPAARPRAFLAHEVIPACGQSDALLRVRESIALGLPGNRVVIEGWSGRETVGHTDPADRVAWRSDGLQEVILEVTARTEAVLVLLDSYAAGWSARLDGVPAPIFAADVAFRAVAVPPGRHEVAFRYRPWSVPAGVALAGAGWMMTLWLAARRLRRRASAR